MQLLEKNFLGPHHWGTAREAQLYVRRATWAKKKLSFGKSAGVEIGLGLRISRGISLSKCNNWNKNTYFHVASIMASINII